MCTNLESIRHAPRIWRVALTTAVLMVAVLSRPAGAITPAQALTPKLETQTINLSQLQGGQLSYFDNDRRLTVAPAGEFVRLTFENVEQLSAERLDVSGVGEESAAPLIVELIDGQRLAGQWSGAARDGEALVWTHATLGRFTLGLDEVRSISRRAASPTPADPALLDGDTLVMNNGDRLVGFVLAAEEAAVTIQPDGADDGVTLPIENVAQLTLTNPPSTSRVAGDLITLADGSRVRGTGVKILGSSLTFTPTLADVPQPVARPLAELRSLDFAASGYRLMELASLPMVYETQTAFGLPVIPTLSDGALRLRSPTTVRFTLPAGVQGFSAQANLDLPQAVSAERAGWANVGLSVGWLESIGDDDASMTRWVLTPDQSAVWINLSPLDTANASAGPRELVVDVDPAANGPVLDRIRITDAVLLVDQPPLQPGSADPDR